MKYTKPPKSAAGPKAILNTARMALKVMKPWKAFSILRQLNQKEGIDCPGCAWPDPQKRSRLGEFCENGVKAIAEEAMSATIDATFFAKHSVESLRKQSDYWLGQQGRLIQPVVKSGDHQHYQPISWNEAFALVADNIKSLNDPNDGIFYTSGRTSNEAAFLYQLFLRL